MRRLTRLTNAFSTKWENLWAAYCLHFAYYTFRRIHKTLRVTPAKESNLTDHVWELAELTGMKCLPSAFVVASRRGEELCAASGSFQY